MFQISYRFLIFYRVSRIRVGRWVYVYITPLRSILSWIESYQLASLGGLQRKMSSSKSQHTYSQYSFGSTFSQQRLNSLACASTSIVILHSLAQVPLDTVLDQLDVSLVCFGICD
ncbi:Hypothetical_protein [Hexamita inflata]|uniref:Hypothetical_protein n=1 Tax=Hexamita inflata TaxID=28002 RepID=A0AA86PSE5_9EUKA|nr:Hypothetical protein HINF_LOCUS30308 [Hexamita inflata]